MSDNQVLDAVDTGALIEAVDIEDLLAGVDPSELAQHEEFDEIAGEVGAALGREFGKALGRELGEVIARAITERPPYKEVIEDAKAAIRSTLRELVVNPDVRASLSEDLRSILEEYAGDLLGSDTVSAALGGEDESESEDEEAEATDEGEETEAEGTDEERQSTGESIPESRDELEDLSYRELQSLAKDRDIQANLSREELTDELAVELDLEG